MLPLTDAPDVAELIVMSIHDFRSDVINRALNCTQRLVRLEEATEPKVDLKTDVETASPVI